VLKKDDEKQLGDTACFIFETYKYLNANGATDKAKSREIVEEGIKYIKGLAAYIEKLEEPL